MTTPSASYSSTIRVEIPNAPGALAQVLTAIGGGGGSLGAIDIVEMKTSVSVRDITFDASDSDHVAEICKRVDALPQCHVINVSDRTFLMHLGGKLEVIPRFPLKTRDDLSMAYTPGVARICEAIAEDPEKSFTLTLRASTVAVVTDGSAVLGLGDIGPEAAMPVMEGKAMLFKEFAGVNAFPICLATKDPAEIVEIVTALAPTFGGINLEDIAAPRCFQIEEALRERLSIPVFHDDQHGTAVVVLAALLNAVEQLGRDLRTLKVVILGSGAAGKACTEMIQSAGVSDVIAVDRAGIIHSGRPGLDEHKKWFAANTNADGRSGSISEALRGADALIGVSSGGLVTRNDVETMAKDPIIFAMANPIPEIMPEEVADIVGVMATGRSDYPNQINNVLCFPGMFKGALECRATTINEEMKLAAANAIADLIPASALMPDYVIPSVFDERVVPAVAAAVRKAAIATGVARSRMP